MIVTMEIIDCSTTFRNRVRPSGALCGRGLGLLCVTAVFLGAATVALFSAPDYSASGDNDLEMSFRHPRALNIKGIRSRLEAVPVEVVSVGLRADEDRSSTNQDHASSTKADQGLLGKKIYDIQDAIKRTNKSLNDLNIDTRLLKEKSRGSTMSLHKVSMATHGAHMAIQEGSVVVSNVVTVRVFRAAHRDNMLNDNSQRKFETNNINRPKGLMEGIQLPGAFSKVGDVLDGIYWKPSLEALVPAGFREEEADLWKGKLAHQKIVRMSAGCGRTQNRLITLEDGTKACARYRHNIDQIQGEVYSYYLARALGIPNVMPTAMASPDTNSSSWSDVRDEVLTAQWDTNKALVLTPWQEGLQAAYIPQELRHTSGKLHPGHHLLQNRDLKAMIELVQWSDLIVLDYLTANTDRVLNNMVNQQWNAAMMDSPTHNLLRQDSSNLLVFLDNESGLFHSYRLLDKYHEFHSRLLGSLCVFRKPTADAIKRMYSNKSVVKEITDILRRQEPRHDHLPVMQERNANILNSRVADINSQIQYCEKQYGVPVSTLYNA